LNSLLEKNIFGGRGTLRRSEAGKTCAYNRDEREPEKWWFLFHQSDSLAAVRNRRLSLIQEGSQTAPATLLRCLAFDSIIVG
jgi:hypothetical protein